MGTTSSYSYCTRLIGYYHVHSSRPLLPILSQMYSVHTNHLISLISILKLQGEHKAFPWLQTFITRKLCRIQTYFLRVLITKLMHNSFILQYMYYIKYLDMFRAILCSSSGGQNCIFIASGIATLCERPCTARLLTESDDTRCCKNKILTSWRWA
jgi:hypothetical protein